MGRIPQAHRKHKPWSQAEDNELRRLRGTGLGNRAMAKLLHRTERGVAKRVHTLGFKVKTKEWRWWTTGEVKRLGLMRAAGKSITECAIELGRTWASTWHKCRELECGRELNTRRLRIERWADILCRPHTNEEAARLMGVDKRSVVSARLRLRRLEYPVVNATSTRWAHGSELTAAR